MKSLFCRMGMAKITISLMMAFIGVMPATVFAGSFLYTVTIDSRNVAGNTATLIGSASATPYAGKLKQQHFDIDWGDGTVENFDTYISDPGEVGNFSFSWNQSHTYADGVYTAKAKLYHQNENGAEASDTEEIRIAVNKGVLTVIKAVNGGTAIPSDFTLNVSGNGSFAGSGTGQELVLNPGTYTVSETPDANYAPTYGNNCDSGGNVTLAAGEFKTCTVTNTYQEPASTLTVNKVVVNDNGGEAVVADFPLFVGTTPVTSDVANEFPAGDYTVSETNTFGYTASFSGDCDTAGNVTLNPGDVKTCTITNNDPFVGPSPATLTVIKQVVNDDGGALLPESFTINVTGGTPSPATFAGSEDGTAVTLAAGDYIVTETETPGYEAEYSKDCSGTIEAGKKKTCTITNDDIAPTLTVTKIVVNDYEGDAVVADFPLYVCPQTATVAAALAVAPTGPCPNLVVSGETSSLDAGTYNILEQSSEAYTATYGGDCDSEGVITLEPGDVKSCTITNNDDGPANPTTGTIIVIKNVVNDNGGTLTPADFTMQVTATDASQASFAGSANGVAVTVAPGTYGVDETAVAGYAKSLGETCSGTIEAGQTVTCTIRNDDIAPTLKVVKLVINDGGGSKVVADFPLYVCKPLEQLTIADTAYVATTAMPLETTTTPGAPCANLVISGEDKTYGPGEFLVKEINNYSYTSTFSGDCDATGLIDLEIGDVKTCTITNNDPGSSGGGGGGGGNPGTSSGGGGGGGYIPRTTTPTPVVNDPESAPEPTPTTEPTVTDEGEVLGETSCGMYLTEYIHVRKKNNPDEVYKLQLFLNEYMGVELSLNGEYDKNTVLAVKKFQLQFADEILKPWGIKSPTGYVYITTRRKINLLKCADLNIEIPSPLVRDGNVMDNE